MRLPKTDYLRAGVATQMLTLHNRHFLLADIIIGLLAPVIALYLRTDTLDSIFTYGSGLLCYIFITLVIRILFQYRMGCYRQFWRYASVGEIFLLGEALTVATAVILVLFFAIRSFFPALALPNSVPLIDSLLALPLIVGVRSLIRLTELWRTSPQTQKLERTLIIGAGETGVLIVREMQRRPEVPLFPVAFLDDSPDKQRMVIHGVPVKGAITDLATIVQQEAIRRVVIAMPSAPGKRVSEVVKRCSQIGVPVQTMPGVPELLNGKMSISHLRPVQIEDLLRREPIQTDNDTVKGMLCGKRVLVTGGGGSIGRELCRQILSFAPRQLLLLGHGENSVFEATQELRRLEAERRTNEGDLATPAIEIVSLIADLRFADRVQHLLEKHRPDVVFHAAAHKHVPLMEENPVEAITNNVLGTQNLLAAVQQTGVQRFVMISTDKAVNPTSVMGASKRVAEFLVHQAAHASGKPYMVVRFGNVLGSRGSVLHTFRQQIASGGPVTVTHPEMKRYFMTIPEAVQLVLQAFTLGKGGEVFMLNMGEPIKIVDLARDLISLSGLKEGVDIEINYSGLRIGEKLFEEMFTPGEEYIATAHEKVLVAANASGFIPAQLQEAVADLAINANRNDDEAIVRALKLLLPEYEPQRPGKSPKEAVLPDNRTNNNGTAALGYQPVLGVQ